jgi:hypothetical protein
MASPYHFAHARTIATWLLRLTKHDAVRYWLMRDEQAFALFYATLKPRVQWPEAMASAIESYTKEAKGEIRFDAKAFDAWKKSEENTFVGKLSSDFLENLYEGTLVFKGVKRTPQIWDDGLNQLVGRMDKEEGTIETNARHLRPQKLDPAAALPPPGNSLFHDNLNVLNWIVQLDDDESQLLELGFLMSHDESVQMLFTLATRQHLSWRLLLEAILERNDDEVDTLTSPRGKLMQSGLLSIDVGTRQVFEMSGFWKDWFSTLHLTVDSMFSKFVRPLVKKPNAGALGRMHPEDQAIVKDLIVRKRYDCSEPGLNVLFYGPRSIDKTGLLFDELTGWGLQALTLGADIPDRDLASVAYVAQRYVHQTNANGVLVITAADKVLTRTRRTTKMFTFLSIEMDDAIEDTEADAALLADNPAKTIWLVNAPDCLSEDNLGRFLYTTEIRAASRAERKAEIEATLKGLDVSPDFHIELSQHLRLSEQQLKSAHRLVSEVQDEQAHSWVPDGMAHGSTPYREALIRRTIDQSQRAMNRRERENLRQPITTYSLDLINVSGAFTVEQIIQSLRHRPSSSLCFHGLPGTGKTLLAEHIAVTLDKPIIMKRASELSSKYVGESEKLIKAMFDEAAEEDSVLFLDEADSFLMDRSKAERSYETSCVNEMLQGMERFRGIFICATNLFSRLDRAALRRFTFKLEFMEMTEDQRWLMLCNEAKIDLATVDPDQAQTWKEALPFLYAVTPGDFATVQRQCQLLNVSLTPDQWLSALKQETELKRKAIQAEASSARGTRLE